MPRVTIDTQRCLAHGACVRVCAPRVFALRPMDPSLPLLVRLRLRLRGGVQARVVDEAACTGCMACVEVCPESAIAVE